MITPLSLCEVAAMLGRKRDWMYRHWPELVKDQGFPLPLHNERPLVWDALHVLAWVDRRLPEALQDRVLQLRNADEPACQDPAEPAGVAAWRDRLSKQYAGAA